MGNEVEEVKQDVINKLVPITNLLEKGLIIQADRKLRALIEELAEFQKG